MKNLIFIPIKLWKTIFLSSLIMVFALIGTSPSWGLEEKDLGSQAPAPALQNTSGAPADGSLADEAGGDFKGGAKSLGNGFKKGAKVTGGAFKKAGTTMGRAFKTAGRAIKEFFTGKKNPEVEERNVAEGAAEATGSTPRMEEIRYNRDLDQVGDEPEPGKKQAQGELIPNT